MADREYRAPLQDPEASLERALIDEFLHERGYDLATLNALPPELARELFAEASEFAAGKLVEVAARAHYIHELHHNE